MRKFILIGATVLGLLVTWITMLIVFAGNSLIAAILGIAGILLVPLVMVLPAYGLSGLKAFIGRLLQWRVHPAWYVAAVLLPLSIQLSALAIVYHYSNLWLPLNPAYWNLAYLGGLFLKLLGVTVLGVVFAGSLRLRIPETAGGFRKSLTFCLSLIGGMALLILAAMVSYGPNYWLFIGLIPVAFIALWISEKAGKSLLPAGLFILAFLSAELLSPANWLLTGGFPEAMMLGAFLYFIVAALLVVADRRFFFPAAVTRDAGKRDPGKLGAVPPLAVLAVIALVAVVALTYLVISSGSLSYPEPSGPFKVGKTAYHWVDQNRSEIATGNSTPREVMVYVWYPAEVTGNMSAAPAMDARTALAIRKSDNFNLGFLADISDHTYPDAPLSTGRPQYPVLIMSHGDGSSPLLLTVTAAELASHGYIVAGVSHTYNSRGTVFPDGRVITRDFNYSLIQNDPYDLNLSYYENAKGWARHNADVEAREADDVSFVIDRLEQLNQSNSPFKGKIDMGRIGTLGYSLGGAVAVASAERDDRIRAAADIDGAVYHNTSIQKPTLSFYRGSLLGYNRSYDALNQKLLTPGQFTEMKTVWDGYEEQVYTSPPTAYFVGIRDTEHGNFNDLGALGIPVDIGHTDGRQASRITSAYLLAFFDKHLNGIDSPLLNGARTYPEVVFKSHVDGVPGAG